MSTEVICKTTDDGFVRVTMTPVDSDGNPAGVGVSIKLSPKEAFGLSADVRSVAIAASAITKQTELKL